MKLLDAIEQGIDRAMTALPEAIFRTRLHREELGQLLVKEMERGSRRERGRKLVPSVYSVRLALEDLDHMGSEQELNEYLIGVLRKAALQKQADYGRRLEVTVSVDSEIKRRRPVIRSEYLDNLQQPTSVSQTLPTGGPSRRFSAALVSLDGKAGRQRIVIPTGTTTIGRAATNHIVLPSEFVSQRHARLETDGKTLRLFDLESTNGTRVNGQTVSQWDVKPGDEIQLGDLRFRLEFTGVR